MLFLASDLNFIAQCLEKHVCFPFIYSNIEDMNLNWSLWYVFWFIIREHLMPVWGWFDLGSLLSSFAHTGPPGFQPSALKLWLVSFLLCRVLRGFFWRFACRRFANKRRREKYRSEFCSHCLCSKERHTDSHNELGEYTSPHIQLCLCQSCDLGSQGKKTSVRVSFVLWS